MGLDDIYSEQDITLKEAAEALKAVVGDCDVIGMRTEDRRVGWQNNIWYEGQPKMAHRLSVSWRGCGESKQSASAPTIRQAANQLVDMLKTAIGTKKEVEA